MDREEPGMVPPQDLDTQPSSPAPAAEPRAVEGPRPRGRVPGGTSFNQLDEAPKIEALRAATLGLPKGTSAS